MKIDARCGDKGWRRRKLLGVWLILAHLAYAIVMAVTNQVHVRFGSKADITWSYRNVRFTPKSGHVQCNSVGPLCANSGHAPFIRSPRRRCVVVAGMMSTVLLFASALPTHC